MKVINHISGLQAILFGYYHFSSEQKWLDRASDHISSHYMPTRDKLEASK